MNTTVFRLLPSIACLAACLIVDLLYFPGTTIFPDEQRFLASAAQLAGTGTFSVGSARAWEMPGTALFFAPAVWLFGVTNAIIPIRLMQAVLLAVQCGLIGFIARRIFERPLSATIASWLAAIYPFFLFYQGLLLSETLFNTLLVAGIAAMFHWRARGMRIDGTLALACLCFGAATLTKTTLTILPPLLLAATPGAPWRRAGAILLAASALYAAMLSPWWIRNAIIFHAFVPFTTGSAQNLYLGNNPANPDAGIDWSRNAEPAVVARIDALPDERARQRAYSQAAAAFIKEDPARFLRAAGKKLVRFWNIIPNAAEFRTGIYTFISAASFGPVLLCALIGVVLHWRRFRLLAPLYLTIAYFTAIHAITIASLRYRLPVEPLLIVLAAGTLATMHEKTRRFFNRCADS